MNRRTVLLLTVVAAICGSLAAPQAQSQPVVATIAETAPVTLLPDPARTPLAMLHEGTQVKLLGPQEEGWYRISFQDNYLFGDRVGYIRVEHVRLPGSSERTGTPPKVASNGARPAGTTVDARTTPRPSSPIRRASLNGLSAETIASAIALAHRQQGSGRGLRLLDSGAPWTRLLSGGAESPSAVRLQIHTPLSWIQQLAADAAREARRFDVDDVTEEMTQPVLRITALANMTNAATTPGRTPRPWMRHIVLRGDARSAVVQPLSKEAFSEHVVNATGQQAVFEGLRLTFPMNAVRKLRGPRGDGDFVIAVIGTGGEEKDLKITKQHFVDLPM
jgi:hypothetical protein